MRYTECQPVSSEMASLPVSGKGRLIPMNRFMWLLQRSKSKVHQSKKKRNKPVQTNQVSGLLRLNCLYAYCLAQGVGAVEPAFKERPVNLRLLCRKPAVEGLTLIKGLFKQSF